MSASNKCSEKYFAVAFLRHLQRKLDSNGFPESARSECECVIRCLKSLFSLDNDDINFTLTQSLFTTFCNQESLPETILGNGPSEEEIKEGDEKKTQGNSFMQSGKYEEAIGCYSEAIKLNPLNPAYFCNRAAAYSKTNDHDRAIDDCKSALKLDPNYAKAYGRMGLALSSQKKIKESVDAYKKATALEPTNESFKNNLKLMQDSLDEEQRSSNASSQQGAAPPNPFENMMGNMGSILNNPAMMQMASQMMQNESVQNFMSQLMTGAAGSGATSPPNENRAPGTGGTATSTGGDSQAGSEQGQGQSAGQNPAGGPGGINLSSLMDMGQRLAAQLEQTNPDLVERLRQQNQGPGGGNNDPNRDRNDESRRPGNGGGSGSG